MKQINKRLLLILLAGILVLAGIFTIYVNDYYHADSTAVSVIENPPDGISITENAGKSIIFAPSSESADDGLIFYPGAKVEYTRLCSPDV